MVIPVGPDVATDVFAAFCAASIEVQGADAPAQVVLRRSPGRDLVPALFGQLQRCVVAMDACGGAQVRDRKVCPMPPMPRRFANRPASDVCLAPVKGEELQGAVMVLRVRELLIRQRTQAIDALRGHLAGFGHMASNVESHGHLGLGCATSDVPEGTSVVAELSLLRIHIANPCG